MLQPAVLSQRLVKQAEKRPFVLPCPRAAQRRQDQLQPALLHHLQRSPRLQQQARLADQGQPLSSTMMASLLGQAHTTAMSQLPPMRLVQCQWAVLSHCLLTAEVPGVAVALELLQALPASPPVLLIVRYASLLLAPEL